ncbi:hypothetical protein NQ314_002629 [Rhamnusium bicolor]|uniref:Odorant receptor n=1 Tax=Rhamnusium bicolor TaxID=1586634 RepID=A0AAV8ZPR9_9CUCU|nr:hypothetical protein NQ314_002629 [Rhamnusium bicolor]
MFGAVGVHPEKRGKMQVLLYLITMSITINVISLVILLPVFRGGQITMLDVTNALESGAILTHGVIKLSALFYKRSNIHDLLTRMKNQFWKIEDIEDEELKSSHMHTLKSLKDRFHLFNILCIITTFSFTCRTFILDGDFLAFDSYRPEWISFYLLLLYESLVFVVGIYFPVLGTDMFMMSLLTLTQAQFKLLNHEIKKIFNAQTKMEEDMEIVNKRIRKYVDQHNFLLDYVNRINDTFCEVLLVYLAIIILSMCVELYIITTQNSLRASIKAISYISAGMFQYIICYCSPAQALSDEADEITNRTYFSKWNEHTTQSVKTATLMILGRSQKKVLITAGGFIKIDLETCLKTLKTMVSYSMFLRTMGNTEK